MESVQEVQRWIKETLIDKIIHYFEGGEFIRPSNEIFIRGYTSVYEFADIADNSKVLYNYYVSTIREYTASSVKGSLSRLKGEELISEVVRRWENHKILVYWMRKIYIYLDRYFVKNAQCLTLCEAGFAIFKSEVFDDIRDNLKNAIIVEIFREREGQSIEIEKVKQCLLCFSQTGLSKVEILKTINKEIKKEELILKGTKDLTVYKQGFEQYFLQDTAVYYKKKSAGWLAGLSCPEYLHEAKMAIESEEERSEKCLDESTKESLLNIVVQEIVINHSLALTEMEGTGCVEMFKQDKLDELKLMYSIFRRAESCLEHITSKMIPYIEKRGEAIVTDQKIQLDSIPFTKSLLEFKAEIDSLVEYSFENHSKFQRCRDNAFQNFMNKCPYSAAHIASYCDNEMVKGLKGVSESEVESRLDALIRLFVCLNDRDVFIKHYTRYLSKRLLDSTSISDDAEKVMINKLTIECGHNIVNKINNMYQDIALSNTLMNEYRAMSHNGSPNGIQMLINVIRNGCWPEQSNESCQMPVELNGPAENFKQFYLNKHTGRNLVFLLNQGHLEMGTLFGRKNYTLIVNPYQAAIALLFNHHAELTIEAIREATKIQDKVLKANLIMFFNPKVKLMNKPSKGKTLNDTDVISLNLDFQSASLKINYKPKKVKKTDTTAHQEDDQAIQAERKNILDSVIVRIAKARKIIMHTELITEVMRQVQHFRPQPAMIKGQIESLIQREFLRRDDEERARYHYIP